MPVNSYECLILLDPTKASSDMEAAKSLIHSTLEKYGAEILASRKWDDRKLAYAIEGQKKGLFYLVFFKLESTKLKEVDHDFRISETVLRHQTIAIDPKWEEQMLAVARDENRMALQLMREEASEGGDGLGGEFGDDGGDRGGRRYRRNAEVEAGKD
jgi:small subunit ribosomal protein S6